MVFGSSWIQTQSKLLEGSATYEFHFPPGTPDGWIFASWVFFVVGPKSTGDFYVVREWATVAIPAGTGVYNLRRMGLSYEADQPVRMVAQVAGGNIDFEVKAKYDLEGVRHTEPAWTVQRNTTTIVVGSDFRYDASSAPYVGHSSVSQDLPNQSLLLVGVVEPADNAARDLNSEGRIDVTTGCREGIHSQGFHTPFLGATGSETGKARAHILVSEFCDDGQTHDSVTATVFSGSTQRANPILLSSAWTWPDVFSYENGLLTYKSGQTAPPT